jgi:hypothetical protein
LVPELPTPTLRRHLRVWGDFLAIISGVILARPFVPGPGITLILLGLALLGGHFVWAKQKWATHPSGIAVAS